MTENEAISELEKFQIQVEHSIAEEECCEYDNSEKELQKDEKFLYAFDMAISALKEIQQYREIGTVEECREAVEKQKPKKPRLNYKPKFFGKSTYTCPRCGNCRLEEFANERQNNNYCWDCGQRLDFGGHI